MERSFLKWAGSKYRMLSHILPLLPPGKRFIEPFLGSGAVFLNTDYPRYLLAECNADLINLYQHLQREGSKFIDDVAALLVDDYYEASIYYQFRDEFNHSDDVRRKALLFVYLNRYGYNGLCRYNSQGGFNVPFGRGGLGGAFSSERMAYFYQKAKRVEFKLADFVDTMQQAEEGDVVYCDPPYCPLSKTANFTHYSGAGFSMEQHQTLASLAVTLAKRGVTVIISNHDTELTRKLYQHAELHYATAQRMISRDVLNRKRTAELIAVFRAMGSV